MDNRQEREDRRVRAALVSRLRARSEEIERVVHAHLAERPDSGGGRDPSYSASLRTAVKEVVRYTLSSIEQAEGGVPVPHAAVTHARLAAREEVGLDTVLRRYAAGLGVLEEFMLEEADAVPRRTLLHVFSQRGKAVDRLFDVIAREYRDESERSVRTPTQERQRRIAELLAGTSLAVPAGIDYDFGSWHVGMVFLGAGARRAAPLLAQRIGCRLLDVPRAPDTVWAWMASIGKPNVLDLERQVLENTPTDVAVAAGEPRRGLDGWRLTHREAVMAQQVLVKRPARFVRGREVVLRAAVMRDETFVRALHDTYLAPLEEDETAEVLRATLRAYFAAGCNATAAASRLGVARHTVKRRLEVVEEKLGQLLPHCQVELQVALQLEELEH